VGHLQAVYYRDPAGFEPVRDFVDALPEQIQAAVENQIARLNLLTDEIPHLPFPHSSQIKGELRELRCHHGRHLYRIFYRRSGRLVILLHVFPKRSAKIPAADIDLAQQRWADFKARMNAAHRVPPRAAGRDAP
jgi:phage-related protein